MFRTKQKQGFLGQVEDFAEDIADRIAPHVDSAREQLAPYIADAREKAGPALADARDKAAPYIADARDKAAPYVADARERFVSDVVPAVSSAVSDARDKAAPYIAEAREEAARRGAATAAALKGEVDPPKKGGKLKKVLLAGGLLGLGAFVFSKLKGKDADPWQSTYTPPPPPRPTVVPDAPADKDDAGASPDEAISDAVAGEESHPVTTPDHPVEETDVSGEDAPKA
ncbi:MAG: hypothetical protein JWO46_1350 [Nocardioidaceae bacterium]|nr:hypothetical protein [Nocardioidaceae bacterium]